MADHNKMIWPGWETVRRIGKGGFGAVYEIQRDVLGETEKAALKVITIPQDDSDLDGFYSDGFDHDSIADTFKSHLKNILAEYSLMRKMNGSSHIVSCDDVRFIQHDDGIGWDIFIKMELLTPLTAAVPMEVPEDVVVKVARDMCAALELCKKYEIVHRDIKPQNIFLSPNGDYKLGDFGIARTMEKTMGATKIGTFDYMAPEVYNNRPYGTSADIYSLGLALYWMLNDRRLPFLPISSGMPSFEEKEIARLRRFAGEAIPAPRRGSKDLQKIVLKACAFDPKDRYQSAQEMLEALNGLQKEAPVVIPEIRIPDPPKPEESEPDDKRKRCFTPINGRKTEEQKKDDVLPESDDQTEVLFHSPNYNRQTKSNDRATVLPYRTKEGRSKIVPDGAERAAGTAAPMSRNEKTRRPKKGALWAVALLPLALFAVILLMVFVTEKPADSQSNMQNMTHDTILDLTDHESETKNQLATESQKVTDITLNVWVPAEEFGDEDSGWLFQCQRAFEAAHPEYRITWISSVCGSGDVATYAASYPSDVGDVYMFSSDLVSSLEQKGALTELTGDYLAQVKADVSETYVNSVTCPDGGVYGFPITCTTWFMYYNKAVFSEEDVKSLNTMLEKGKVAFAVTNSWYTSAFFFANGCRMFGDHGVDATAGIEFGGDKGYEAGAAILDLVTNTNYVWDSSGANGSDMLAAGTVDACFGGFWDYAMLKEAMGDNLGCAQLPTVKINGADKQMKAFANTKAIGVNPNAEYHDAAMEFAAFLASAESQLLHFELLGATPAVTELISHPAIQASEVVSAEMRTMAYTAVAQPHIPEMSYYWDPASSFGRDIIGGKVDSGNLRSRIDEMMRAMNQR